jgi:hypothetical protein
MSESAKRGAKRFGLVILVILFILVILIGLASIAIGLVIGPCNAIGVAFDIADLKDNEVSYFGVSCYGWALIPLSIIAIIAACYGIPAVYDWFKKSFKENKSNGYTKVEEQSDDKNGLPLEDLDEPEAAEQQMSE